MFFIKYFLTTGHGGYAVDVSLIPRTLTTGQCPQNTKYRPLRIPEHSYIPTIHTCNCEDHCNWDMCNLVLPPKECLLNTNSIWQWDDWKNTWVAQVILGINALWFDVNIIREY